LPGGNPPFLRFAQDTIPTPEGGGILGGSDDFKLINDTYGHPTGDMALRHVALLLDRCARDSDIAARLGGDEFLLILPGASHAHSVDVAERLTLLAQETPLRIDGAGFIPLRMSIGVAAYPNDAIQSHTLLTIADTRLYEAKKSGGRGRIGRADGA